MRRPWVAVTAVAAFTVCAAVVSALVFGRHSPTAATVAGEGLTAVTSPTVQYPITLPLCYQPPTGLAPDAANAVWFFAQGLINDSPQETLFHWSTASHSLASYAVDTSKPSAQCRAGNPIVADQSSRAWLGINHTLLVRRWLS